MPNNISFRQFKASCENVLAYDWEEELEDFSNMMLDEGAVKGHIFWDMFVLSNVLRVLDGEDPESLTECFDDSSAFPGCSFYRCHNPKCRAICTRPDGFPSLPILDDDEPVPGGLCPVCGDHVSKV